MANKSQLHPANGGVPGMPRDAVQKLKLGQSFAEYDATLEDPYAFVTTPGSIAASDSTSQKYFFVGRRGTGKTATSLHVAKIDHHARAVDLGIMFPEARAMDAGPLANQTSRPFRGLVASFRHALLDEVALQWMECCGASLESLPSDIQRDAQVAKASGFDERLTTYVEKMLSALAREDETEWRRWINIPKSMVTFMERSKWAEHHEHVILLDRLDESWDGSDIAVVYLTALMHAALHLNSNKLGVRILIFLRENVFERVRALDPEFARLETSVVGMDWTREQLEEMIERRLSIPFNTRLALGGPTWDAFFADPERARQTVFEYCQNRPRDVLIYCDYAVEEAIAHHHHRILADDVVAARRRFSDSRLRDLGDEYSENYPQISMVLSRFYGLGTEYTLRGMEDLLGILLSDPDIKEACASWIFGLTLELFVRLLYNIGFVGLTTRKGTTFRSTGPRDTTPPPISTSSTIHIHRSYWDALDLQETVINELDESRPYQRVGLVADLPEAMTPESYQRRLTDLLDELNRLKAGAPPAEQFAELVGEIIKLCFNNVLTNVESKVRSVSGNVIRDWMCSNRADSGFWEMIRHRYGATQVTWECKNTENLAAEDFHQVAYYLGQVAGRFGIVAHRGEWRNSYAEHIKRIATDKDAMVLVVGDRDLKVFLRQAKNGKVKDSHLQDIYDRVCRLIS